jgi:hypothetical protein
MCSDASSSLVLVADEHRSRESSREAQRLGLDHDGWVDDQAH